MKKTRKHVLITLVSLVLVAAIGGLVYMWPLFSMAPAPTGQVAGTYVTALQAGQNTLFILPSEEGYIVVDAGSNSQRAVEGLEAMNISPEEVGHVLLTHSDSDHVAALGVFTNAVVYMGEAERQMVEGTTRRNLFGHNSLPEGLQLVTVRGQDVLQIGGYTVRCLETPGHTPGSTSFLVNGEYLFAGDAVRVQNGVASVHPFTMDKGTAEGSIQLLLGYEGTLLFTAHYGVHETDSLRQK